MCLTFQSKFSILLEFNSLELINVSWNFQSMIVIWNLTAQNQEYLTAKFPKRLWWFTKSNKQGRTKSALSDFEMREDLNDLDVLTVILFFFHQSSVSNQDSWNVCQHSFWCKFHKSSRVEQPSNWSHLKLMKDISMISYDLIVCSSEWMQLDILSFEIPDESKCHGWESSKNQMVLSRWSWNDGQFYLGDECQTNGLNGWSIHHFIFWL